MASSNVCTPTFEIVPEGSFKCCNGPIKNMRLTLRVTDTQDCLNNTASVCIQSVRPSNGGTVGTTTFVGSACAVENGTIEVFLLDVSNCGVLLTVTFTIGTGPAQTAFIRSANIPDGNADAQCLPRAA